MDPHQRQVAGLIRVDKVVPIYGEVKMDKDELNAALMPQNYDLVPKIKAEDTKYETTLCQTKERWGRFSNGSPKEQELEC